ncbi:ATP-binding protein [Succinivibrio dextrinosolvens]|uniref:ATP-binding protein n=1 Tax=Succinivibrio dextrinosolvens TaxID=83771 RepID=UPI00241F3261|nr:ATP-binding protein [Succinivibrio dextrinosolvens]MBE6423414.1 ATP-binding protein [Succinivibrio dextrinosolvens]
MEVQRNTYLTKIINRMHNGMIKVITGIRRSGKSYLLLTLFRKHLHKIGVREDHILVMEFDRFENRQYRDPYVLLDYLKKQITDDGDYYILLDEVQMLHNFEEVLNSLMRESNLDIYVTGSNSKFLSKDILTEFRGRGDEIHIFPLSFQEYMQVYDGDLYHGWAEYVMYGGLPFVITLKTDEQKVQYLTSLIRETYIKDIVERNTIEKQQELEDLLNMLASSIGALTNPLKIEATFKSRMHSSISDNTISKYIGYLKEAFMINEAQRYDVKGRKYIGSPVKYYFEDIGLRNARLDFRQVEETHLMENVIYNELRMRGYNVDVGNVNKRYTDKETGSKLTKNLEIDFVANLGSKRFYIQSAYKMPDAEKIKQEKASLLAINDSFKKIIVVKDVIKPFQDEDGILTIGLFDFLQNSDSLEW